jgi:hypothetical protein
LRETHDPGLARTTVLFQWTERAGRGGGRKELQWYKATRNTHTYTLSHSHPGLPTTTATARRTDQVNMPRLPVLPPSA